MINLFRAEYLEAMNIKNLLETQNIEVFVENEIMSSIRPSIITSGGFNPVILKVYDKDLENARKIIQDYQAGNLNIS